ncbi:hypothetical protein JOQ06_029562 [Pogonophryne albipinna]|nr:hypothetical protein JOQ06_029562 [Pogonophryne albipinna]
MGLLRKLIEEKTRDTIGGYHYIAYNIKEDVAGNLAQNTCMCLADKESFRLPFSNLLFPSVRAHKFDEAFLASHPDPEGVKRLRAKEYSRFQKR